MQVHRLGTKSPRAGIFVMDNGPKLGIAQKMRIAKRTTGLTGALFVLTLSLCGCTPDEDEPSHPDESSETGGSESGTSETETGEESDSWGIKLDVGPPYYSGSGETT